MNHSTRVFAVLAVAACVASCGAVAIAGTVIDDFSGGVTGSNHPDPADGGAQAFSHWYDITNDTFGTPTASTLDGSDALRIDDGGFTNGVYAIFAAVIPADGIYNVSAEMHINEDPDRLDHIAAYQIGAVVNGVHRGPNPSDLATITGAGTAVGNYAGLTAGDDSGMATQLVTTGTFSASAGDNLLIGFSTDLDSGDFDSNSSFWEDGHVLVDNIMLNRVPEPSTFVLCVLGLVALFASRRK